MPSETANVLQPAFSCLRPFVESLLAMNQYVNANFGLFAQVILDLLVVYIVLMLIVKLVKLSFWIVFKIVIPSAILAGIVFLLTSYSFFTLLTVFACILLVMKLVKLQKKPCLGH